MEQQEASGGRETGRKVKLPDHKDAFAIPDKWRLPFHGKMVTPTAVPSPSERQYQIDLAEYRRGQRKILIGLAAAAAAVAIAVAAVLLLRR